MIIVDGKSEIDAPFGTRVVIGKFDGIHAGHQALIKEITGGTDGKKSVVFTFSHHSEVYLNKCERILSDEERHSKFESLGVDYLVEYELNDITAKQEPEEFARIVLKHRLHCDELVCGNDLSFGYKGRGNVELLRSMENELGIRVTVIEKVKYLGADISSSRIRKAITEGNDFDAQNMLNGN